MKTEQNLNELKKLDWKVALLPMSNPITGKPTNFMGTFRMDNGEPFATGLTKSYKVVQNSEMVDIAQTFCSEFGEEMKVKRVWSYGGGTQNTIQVASKSFQVGENPKDTITPLITLHNDHQGTGNIRISSGASFRELCSNGLYVTKQMMDEFSVSHRGDTQAKIEIVKQMMIKFARNNVKLAKVYSLLAQTKMNETKVRDFMAEYFPVSKQSENKQETILRYFHDADNGQIERDTAWNAWNSYTRQITHNSVTRTPRNRATSLEDSRLQSIYHGTGATESAKFLDQIIEFTETRSMVDELIRETEAKTETLVTVEDILAEMGA